MMSQSAVMTAPISILFVCAGNIFRSVAARHIFQSEVANLNLEPYFEFHTAGLIARNGQKVEPELNRELKRMGYQPIDHSATELTQEMVEAADLVLTAEEAQRAEIVKSVPSAAGKTLTMKQISRVAAALRLGVQSVPVISHTGKPTQLSLRLHLRHLLRYRGYATNPNIDAIEDIEDPYDTGKHKEAAREVREAMLALLEWWAR